MQTKEDVMRAKEDSRKMMSNIHGERTKAAEEMRRLLHSEKMKIAREANDLLMRFRKEREETRKEILKSREEILKAFNIWRRFSMEQRKTRAEARLGRRRSKR